MIGPSGEGWARHKLGAFELKIRDARDRLVPTHQNGLSLSSTCASGQSGDAGAVNDRVEGLHANL